jgi:hypothetical protein
MADEGADPTSAPLHKYVTIDSLKRILHGSIRFTQPTAGCGDESCHRGWSWSWGWARHYAPLMGGRQARWGCGQ